MTSTLDQAIAANYAAWQKLDAELLKADAELRRTEQRVAMSHWSAQDMAILSAEYEAAKAEVARIEALGEANCAEDEALHAELHAAQKAQGARFIVRCA